MNSKVAPKIDLCLFQPEIPQNTGSIGRLAAATRSTLHLVKPLGFSLDDKYLKRAGLDYWKYLDFQIHENLENLLESSQGRFALLTKKSQRPYTEIGTETSLFIFGRETTGLPSTLLERYEEFCYGIPMFHPGVRSLNLANAVSIVLYDQLARRGSF